MNSVGSKVRSSKKAKKGPGAGCSLFGYALIGLVVAAAGVWSLIAGEIDYAETMSALEETERAVVVVDDVSEVVPALHDRVIHACALADTDQVLVDDEFGVREVALIVERKVEYYQYKESESTDSDGNTTYSYSTLWVPSPIDSDKFHRTGYKNSVLVKIASLTQHAENPKFGGYTLPESLVTAMGGAVPAMANPSGEQLVKIHSTVEFTKPAHTVSPEANTSDRNSGSTGHSLVHVFPSSFYFGKSPNEPSVGDVRVTLSKVPRGDVCVIAKVTGSTFAPYKASNGTSVSMVTRGTVSAGAMFDRERAAANESVGDNRLASSIVSVFGAVFCGGSLAIWRKSGRKKPPT